MMNPSHAFSRRNQLRSSAIAPKRWRRNIEPNSLLSVHRGRGKAVIKAHMNDDRSRLLDLITCVDCNRTMKLERIDPDEDGEDLILYRCAICQRREVVRLTRRRWPNSP